MVKFDPNSSHLSYRKHLSEQPTKTWQSKRRSNGQSHIFGSLKIRRAKPVKVSRIDLLKAKIAGHLLTAFKIKALVEERVFNNPDKAARTTLKGRLFLAQANKVKAARHFGGDFISPSKNIGRDVITYTLAAKELQLETREMLQASLKGICAGECLICAGEVLDSLPNGEDRQYETKLVGIAGKFAKGSSEQAIIAQHKYLNPKTAEAGSQTSESNWLVRLNSTLNVMKSINDSPDVVNMRRVANEKGMDLTTARDLSDISQLTEKVDGTYRIGISWEGGKEQDSWEGHDVLFIKRGRQMHLFDPNYGLIRCNKENLEETFQKLFSFYPSDLKNPTIGDHHVVFSEYVKQNPI